MTQMVQGVLEESLPDLQRSLAGRLILPGDTGYDEARTVFNSMIDKRPAIIAQCATPDDVAAALRFGRGHGLDIAVRSGGHSVAGMSLCDGGLVIDVRPMKHIEVDPDRRIARVGAGCTWGEIDRATQEHGLATTGGRVSSTGVAGLTLGGGSGWLERKYGLACDNLIAVELVTADGTAIVASAQEHPDLFWALHGGGGNFGVATAFTFQLHPVGPQVLAGLLLYPAERGRELLRLLRDVLADAADEFGPAVAYLTVPADEELPAHLHGRLVSALVLCHAGPVEEGERVIEPFRALGPEADLVGAVGYADFQCSIDDPPGYRNWWTAEYLHVVTDEAIDVIHAHSLRTPSPGPAQSFVVPWGGAVARVSEEQTPMTQRDATWVVHPFALWDDPADDEAVIGWARGFRDDLRHFASGGVYLNFIGDEGEDRVRAAYGEEKYQRLAAIKRRYDPDNVFRGNQNIKPAGGCPMTSRTRAEGAEAMSQADDVVRSMCERYARAVNANDSHAYAKLFTADAIRMPPGSDPERGPEQIRRGEQADYDVAHWTIRSRPIDVLAIDEQWIYGIAHVDATTTTHADEATKSFSATKTWLLQRQDSGEWLIARQMWNFK